MSTCIQQFSTLMVNRSSGKLALIVICILTTVSCAEVQVKLKDAGDRIEAGWKNNRHKIEGCAVGAIGGGFAGYVMARSKTGLAIGMAAGCALGVKAANKFEERRKKYANLEQFHEAELANAKQLNAKLKAENKYHRTLAANYDGEIRSVRRATSGKSAQATALKSQISASLKRAKNAKDDALIEIAVKDGLAKELEEKKDFKRADALRAEADAYQRKIDILSGVIEGYNRQSATVGGLV